MKKKYDVQGMSCSACAAHVGNAVNKLEGYSCNVNLLTNSMEVEAENIVDEEVIKAVQNAGYNASIKENEYLKTQTKKTNTKLIKLIISIVILVLLMYVAMGDMIHLPMPSFLQNIIVNVYTQLVLTISIIVLEFHYYNSGYRKLFKLKPNMDSLVAVGSTASFIYALVNTILITIDYSHGVINHELHHSLYYDGSAMILVFVSIGKYLESLSKKQTTKALDELLDLVPNQTLLFENNIEKLVATTSVEIGQIIKVRPFDLIPIDGIITEGSSLVDESSLTGESLEVLKEVNDEVRSGTKNGNGTLLIKTTKRVEDSTMNQIIKMVEQASTSKMNIERIVDKVALYFVPIVFGISLLTLIIWLIVGQSFVFSLKMFISVVVISCPCALGLATPLVVMVSTLKASKNNILVKEAEVFERLSKIDVVMFDKTGTITANNMKISKNTLSKENMKILSSLEKESNHPLSRVIIENQKDFYEVEDFNTVRGRGISGLVNNIKYYAGSIDYVNDVLKYEDQEEIKGTLIYLFTDKEVLGKVIIKDEIKKTSKESILLFKKMNIKTVMLTGDNLEVATDIASTCSIDEVRARLLPLDKSKIIDEYQELGHKVLMIGDGINDSVALEKAYVGMAMNETSIAKSSADIILTKSDLLDAYNAYYLSLKTVKNIKINLFWAFIYNIITIPLAAGILYHPLNLQLSPMIASICMSLSSVTVCLNALRLNLIKFEKEKFDMEFYCKDMMCEMCVKHVKKALEVEGVSKVDVDLKTKLVKVDTSLSKEEIFKLVDDAGYKASEK